ncbi:MAG TPA: cation:proton antiporter, partial [Pseudobdellovibrionaceae bacterium]|nr:cation:proton antiporter [Pseudobdellovibrionaceae bacterium]
LLSNEIMLIVSIGLCLLMVVLATKANFSAAIGAFIMGSILAETEEGERIEHLMSSVKDLFAAVFFVSVGMMINPEILQKHFWVVILITIITIVGKLMGSGFGAVLSGRSLKHSTRAGMSLAQIGEFSFIIASLGVSLKVVSDFLYPIVIAVSAVTTFTTPYLIRYSDPLYSWIEARLPRRFLDLLGQYERAMATNGRQGALGLLWETYGLLLLLNSVVVLAIGLAAAQWGLPSLISALGDERHVRFAACIVTLAACSPFLYGVVFKTPKIKQSQETTTIFRLTRLQFGLLMFRGILGLALVEVIISQFAATQILPLAVLVATPLLIYFFRGFIGRFYSSVEDRFLKNLNSKELAEVESMAQLPALAPWNANLTQMVISSDSRIAGQTLEESKFRTTTGATVAMIDRGRRRIFAPSRSERLLPNDELFLIGTEEQLGAAQKLIQAEETGHTLTHDESFSLESFMVENGSRYANQSIRAIGVGAEFGGLIVGVERGGSRILNPESNIVLQPGDLVWVFGHKKRIRDLEVAARPL